MQYKKIICFAPHPDDETLGMGGTLIKKKSQKYQIDIVNCTQPDLNYPKRETYLKNRKNIQKKLKKIYKIKNFLNLKYFSTKLDQYSRSEIINEIHKILIKGKYDIVYLPFIHDIHTDHQILTECILSCVKTFNNKYVKKVLMYETISETNFNYLKVFKPNHFEDISYFIKKKIEALKLYKSELHAHPHPRSLVSSKSLALMRGSQSGYKYAEAFQIVFSRNDL